MLADGDRSRYVPAFRETLQFIHYLLRYVRTHSLDAFAGYLFVFAPLSALVIWLR